MAVLRFALPRRDIKPVADALLTQFGSFVCVTAAPSSALHHVVHLGEAGVAALKTVHAAAIRLLRARVIGRSVVEFHSALIHYLTAAMAYECKEQLRVLFLDHLHRLVTDEILFCGTTNYTPAYPREIIERALELQAPAMIIVHNHPSGDPNPSGEDVSTTIELEMTSTVMELRLLDHLIIGTKGWYSFRQNGRLKETAGFVETVFRSR